MSHSRYKTEQVFIKDFLYTTSQESTIEEKDEEKNKKYLSCVKHMREFLQCKGKSCSFNIPIKKETTIIKNLENDDKSYKETEIIGNLSVNYKCCPSSLNINYEFQNKMKQRVKISHSYVDDLYIKKYKPEEHFCLSLYRSISKVKEDISSSFDMSDSVIYTPDILP